METRSKINALNVLLTCVFLFVAVEISDGGSNFAKKINKITENLDKAVLNLSNTVIYTDYNSTAEYVSNVQFSAKGMAGLYNLTTMFMDVVLPTDFFMEGLLTVNDRNLNVNIPDYKDALHYYWRPFTIIAVLLGFLAFFPLCGICFCFCRCCGNCGARSKPADKKRDLCAKIIQGTILIALGTGLLFCVVCAFGSNQQLQDGIKAFPTNMRSSVNDTTTFLNQTQNETSHLLINNYIEFVNVFSGTMDDSTSIIMDQLEVYSNATGMLKLAEFVENMPIINKTLYSLRNHSNRLRVYASQLNDALRKVKGDLLGTLQECVELNIDGCVDLNNKITRLETNIDFNKLPDVSEQIELLSKFDTTGVSKAAKDGMKKLDDIKDTIGSKLQDGISQARVQINKANETITEQLNKMFSKLDDIKREVMDNSYASIDTADEYISQYGHYSYYAGLGISCILLLVTLCIALGLICGICGKRPDGYSDNCCNKGAGSQFLVCAVMIMFFFGCVLVVITLAMFLLGATSDRAICAPLRNPDPQEMRIIKVIDDLLSLNDQLGLNDIKFSNILKNCYQNKSLYQTLNLNSIFDIEKLKTNFNISEYLDQIKFDDLLGETDFCILCNGNDEELKKLKDLKFDVDLDKFREELENNFTNFNLDELTVELQNVIIQLNNPPFQDIKTKLELSALHLDTYNEKLLSPMKALANDVIDSATDLQNNITMGSATFAEAIDILIAEIRDAEVYLKNNGTTKLGEIAKEFTEVVLNQVNSYINRISDQVGYKIGECGPLNVVINATLISTCDKVLLPWNGFWFSLFWSLVLYVFTIVICVKLASLYQKYKPYGQYVETRGGKRNKKNDKKSKRHEDRPPSAGGEVVAREYTVASHPPDGRYADMAPKHWEEFPNGGPPQYQRAATEYERPPPYYYPGSAGEQ